ncbi:phage tail protein [Pseudomonas lactis]|uniref:phage tail protein n=1 Tax=Pseudomonas lactis TaxID=1615674 RepID=UPI001EE39F83|nr:phage tail protein [Pseudomonas lactis]
MIDQNSQFFATLTKVGEAKQANADALGIAWKLTQMGVGDAGGTDPIPSSLQTKLINERRRAPLNQLSIDPQNPSILIAEQVIPADVGGFWVREIGLYDADNDLVAVANCAPSFKPILSQGSGRTQIVRMNFVVKSANNVELKIDPSVVLATRAYVDDMKAWFYSKWVAATEKVVGVLAIATQLQTDAGNDDATAVTPKKLSAWFGTKWLPATEAASGVLPIATQTEVLSGFGDSAVVTPKKLTAKLTSMVATQAETNGGEDGTKFVTPLRLATWFGTKWLTATEAASGVLPIATQAEVNSGFGDSSVVTPLKLAAWFVSKWLPATEAVSGVLPIATQTEVLSGFGDSAVVTPKKLSTKFTAMVATQLETNAGEDGSKFITPLKLAAWFGTKWLTATEATSGVLPIAKQVEVDSGFGDSSVVTPKKLRLGFQFIIGVNGAIVFPTWLGGFVLQWGAVSLSDAGVATVTFPIKFPSQRLATWSALNANISTWANTVPATGTAGGTDPLVNMVVSYNDNGGVATVSVGWFAIGK